jgi:hypothetical protein
MLEINHSIDDITKSFSIKRGILLDEAIKIEKETHRYLELVTASKNGYSCLSPIVDDFWHNMVLNTEIYADFCQKTYDKFIHHIPESYKTVEDFNLSRSSYKQFLIDYESKFSESPPEWIWPKEFELTTTEGGCVGCNGCSARPSP